MVSLDVLEKYYQDGLLLKQVHPIHDLTIWNYSPKVQYEHLWDDITIMCRGLVTNSDGDIIAQPFKKFWNIEEKKHTPTNQFSVLEKMDGSLILGFFYGYEFILSSRGSFRSDQSMWASDIMVNKYRYTLLTDKDVYEATGYEYGGYELTYIFELIKKENRIVVDYGEMEDLVLLSVIHTKTNKELEYEKVKSISEIIGCPVVKLYDGISDYEILKEKINNNQEGFVIKFSNGDMCKVKGDEYCRLHKILTNISNRDIWEYLKEDKPFDEILEKVPDEFYDWVKETVKDFLIRYENIEKDYTEIYQNLKSQNLERKDFAFKARHYRHSSILFNMLDGKDYKQYIWKILYPNYSKPFKKNEN